MPRCDLPALRLAPQCRRPRLRRRARRPPAWPDTGRRRSRRRPAGPGRIPAAGARRPAVQRNVARLSARTLARSTASSAPMPNVSPVLRDRRRRDGVAAALPASGPAALTTSVDAIHGGRLLAELERELRRARRVVAVQCQHRRGPGAFRRRQRDGDDGLVRQRGCRRRPRRRQRLRQARGLARRRGEDHLIERGLRLAQVVGFGARIDVASERPLRQRGHARAQMHRSRRAPAAIRAPAAAAIAQAGVAAAAGRTRRARRTGCRASRRGRPAALASADGVFSAATHSGSMRRRWTRGGRRAAQQGVDGHRRRAAEAAQLPGERHRDGRQLVDRRRSRARRAARARPRAGADPVGDSAKPAPSA